MKRNLVLSALTLVVGACALMFINSTSASTSSPAASTTLVISQVYGGGGAGSTSTATYTKDYVEIKNISNSIQSLSGLSLYYGSSTGQFASSASTAFALPAVSLSPGQYYLVELGSPGLVGAALPVTADQSTTNLSMSATNGKVALVSTLPQNTCGATATPCSLPNASIVDLVSWGAANNAEGGAAVAVLSNTTGAVRKNNGCTDTDNNAADFDVVTNPVPRNSATPLAPCAGGPSVKSRADFDGDGKTDPSVFRGSEGNWYTNNSTTGFNAVHFGQAGDIVVPGDYDADGKADYAVFRASDVSGAPDFYVLNSNGNTVSYFSLGSTGDIPVAGDYDGDGKSDFAVFRASIGYWFINNSSTGTTSTVQFGTSADVPFTMDNDNDGKSNLAVFRANNGTWYIARSTGTPSQNFDAVQFGQDSDVPVPADYDGDNKEDVAVFRPSNGTWYILRSSDGQVSYQQFGTNGDIAVPGDYDGDGKDDVAVYRSGVWYINRSTSGFQVVNFGTGSDVPVPQKYHP